MTETAQDGSGFEPMDASPQAPLQVFIVENHPDTLLALTLYFEDLGHQVHSAGDMAGALEALRISSPDLLLCDIGLPDGMGWELLQTIPAAQRPPYAVAMSGFGLNADTVRSEQAGFRRHLLKPFKIHEFIQIIAEARAEREKRK